MIRYQIGWWPPRDAWPYVRFGIFGTRHDGWRFPAKAIDFTHTLIDSLPSDAILVSGRSPGGGVDIWAERYWRATRDPERMQIFEPDWKTYGRAAPFHRNTLIVSSMDRGFGIHNGVSRGTLDTAYKAARVGKPVVLFTLE